MPPFASCKTCGNPTRDRDGEGSPRCATCYGALLGWLMTLDLAWASVRNAWRQRTGSRKPLAVAESCNLVLVVTPLEAR